MSIFDPKYNNLYMWFKKLPALISILDALGIFIWSIVDASTSFGGVHGILGLRSAFGVLLFWWFVGFVFLILNWFFLSLLISPIITATDAILVIKEKIPVKPTIKQMKQSVEVQKQDTSSNQEEYQPEPIYKSTANILEMLGIDDNTASLPYQQKQEKYQTLVKLQMSKKISYDQFQTVKEKLFGK